MASTNSKSGNDCLNEDMNLKLFLTNSGLSIEFYLKLKDEDEKKILAELLLAYGGTLIEKEGDITSWTAIMTDNPFIVNSDRPFFRKDYIRDCVEQKKLLDITDYAVTRKPLLNGSMMNVLFWRKNCFPAYKPENPCKTSSSNLRLTTPYPQKSPPSPSVKLTSMSPPIPGSAPQPESSSKNASTPSSDSGPLSIPCRALVPTLINHPKPLSSPSPDCMYLVDEDSDDEYVPCFLSKVHRPPYRLLKSSRAPYTMNEKEDMLRFLIEKDRYIGLKGDRVWKTMEVRGICPRRTSQSLKEHFSKVIIHQLDRFSFLTHEQKDEFRKRFFQ